jgi:AcrR family transcriptional regulator
MVVVNGPLEKRHTRPPKITRTDILGAAITLLDEKGYESLSMGRLAERLGVSTMALYRHVQDRKDLEAGVIELTFRDLRSDAQPVDDWRIGVEQWMRAIRAHWHRHPWIGSMLRSADHVSSRGFVVMDQLVRIMAKSELDLDDRAKAVLWIIRITIGLVYLELYTHLPFGTRHDTLRPMIERDNQQHWVGMFERISGYTDDDVFDMAVRIVVGSL